MENKSIRTRIAPSPTGFPHIGTVYQALFNFAFAKKYNGKFIIRIEDTDRARFVQGAEEIIYETLDWFNLPEDESPRKSGEYKPYRQSQRLEIYHSHVQKLLEINKAYFAFYPRNEAGVKKDYSQNSSSNDTSTESITNNSTPPKSIQEMIESGDWIIRMRVPKNETISIYDGIRGEILFESNQVSEQVLLKSDGYPTYHLAVVVDDYLMKISHVVRAEEWITSTPKHVLLYKYFGWELPLIFHTPDLRNPDKSKLSKRHGHTNVIWYKNEGYLPEAILNYLALLGWTHPEEKEIFSLSEFVQKFELKDIRAVGPIFDLQKLTWMNGEYIRQFSDEKLNEKLQNFYKDDKELLSVLDGEHGNLYVQLSKERMKTLKDFKSLVSDEIRIPKLSMEDINKSQKLFDQIKKSNCDWNNKEELLTMLKELKNDGISMKHIYFFITRKERGLPLIELMQLWGKNVVLQRLQQLSS